MVGARCSIDHVRFMCGARVGFCGRQATSEAGQMFIMIIVIDPLQLNLIEGPDQMHTHEWNQAGPLIAIVWLWGRMI